MAQLDTAEPEIGQQVSQWVPAGWVEQYPVVRGATSTSLDRSRFLDLTVLILLAPIWLSVLFVLAVAVKISDPGSPVLFGHDRTGFGGRHFSMYKFRTMVPDAEKMKRDLAHLNELAWPDFKISDDPRVTRIGKVLRKYSLDELPQLFNVLRGDMRLVGPRPTSIKPESYDRVWQHQRLDGHPGLTGLWQVTSRADVEWCDRVRLDVAYLRRRCVALDVEILIRTIPAVVRGTGR